MPFAYPPYLVSKISVDDRALNAAVLKTLQRELAPSDGVTVRVLELGAGIGTMPARLVDWQLLTRAHYTLLDADAALLHAARTWLVEWARMRGYDADASADGLHVRHAGGLDLQLRFIEHDLSDSGFFDGARHSLDLLVANAVLDLVHVPTVLPGLLELLDRNGLYWFSINFDGESIFIPEHPDDARLLSVYHASMDHRVRGGAQAGDSKTGRHLFTHLRAAGATILQSGSSDWVVFANQGKYPGEEAEFLRCIVQTIHDELMQHADVPRTTLEAWTKLRSQQIEAGELVYLAHQLDFVGRRGR